MSAPGTPLLSCNGLQIGYSHTLVPPVSMTIRAGELWAIVGSNGAGKSTWMRTALKLQSPLAGEVNWGAGVRAAYVPQAAALDPIYPVRVRDLVEMGRLRKGRFLGYTSRADRHACREALARVGAENLMDRPFRDLSGGQRQRVLIARALTSEAQLYFFDEPTSALDRQSEAAVLEIIDTIRKLPNTAVALITHQLQVLRGRADHALFLDREHGLAVVGTAAEVTHNESFKELIGDLTLTPAAGQP